MIINLFILINLLIITIIIIYYQLKKNFINSLKYGTIFGSFEKSFKKYEFKYVNVPFNKILNFCPKPPTNTSEKTYKELKFLRNKIKYMTDNEILLFNLLDENVSYNFKKFIKKYKLNVNYKELEIFINELEQIVYKLKYVFNRPRAYQLGEYLGIPIKAEYAITGNTPAYPSGHALLGYGIYYYLSYFNPKYKKQLKKLARQVDYSRINVGVHYVSDGLASQIVIKNIFKLIKNKFVGNYNNKKLYFRNSL